MKMIAINPYEDAVFLKKLDKMLDSKLQGQIATIQQMYEKKFTKMDKRMARLEKEVRIMAPKN